MARGTIPCDILFVGEAPGESEDVLGRPFVGIAGKLLDTIIEQSIGAYNKAAAEQGGHQFSYALTNLVACIPRGEDHKKVGEPDAECIEECKPRLEKLIEIASPKLIVAVGKLAEQYLEPGYKHSVDVRRDITRISITHPAAILRANPTQKGLMVQRCRVTIVQALEDL